MEAAILVETTTLDGVIRAHAGEPDDDAFIRLVIGDLLSEQDPAELLIPLIRGYLLSKRRGFTRAKEHHAWRGPVAAPAEPGVRVRGAAAVSRGNPAMTERLRPLLDETIHIPGHGKVRWGQATVTQLQARIRLYEQTRTALDRSVADLTHAITEIKSHPGANCLDDIYR